MRMRLEAARLLTYQSAWLLDQGRPNTSKPRSQGLRRGRGDAGRRPRRCRLRRHGLLDRGPVESSSGDAKVLQIYEGTSEIQRNIIARELQRGPGEQDPK